MTEQISQPMVRVRIAHAHTLKEGWRLSETTVEWSGPAGQVDWEQIQYAMVKGFDVGEQEAAARRAQVNQ